MSATEKASVSHSRAAKTASTPIGLAGGGWSRDGREGQRDSGRGNRNPDVKSQAATPKLSDLGISKTQSSAGTNAGQLGHNALLARLLSVGIKLNPY